MSFTFSVSWGVRGYLLKGKDGKKEERGGEERTDVLKLI